MEIGVGGKETVSGIMGDESREEEKKQTSTSTSKNLNSNKSRKRPNPQKVSDESDLQGPKNF